MANRGCRCRSRGLVWVIAHLLCGDNGRHTVGRRSSCRSRVPTASAALYQDGATKDGGTDEGENDGS